MVNREAIGIITGIDKPDAHVDRVRNWLKLAGCKKIFPVSSITGEGIKELAEYLEDDEDRARKKALEEQLKAQKKPTKKRSAKKLEEKV